MFRNFIYPSFIIPLDFKTFQSSFVSSEMRHPHHNNNYPRCDDLGTRKRRLCAAVSLVSSLLVTHITSPPASLIPQCSLVSPLTDDLVQKARNSAETLHDF